MNEQEKLEEIIKNFNYYHTKSKTEDNLKRIITYLVGDDTNDFITKLAEAILKDYVRREEMEKLIEALKLYRESHNYCIEGSPQGLCNKCRISEDALHL